METGYQRGKIQEESMVLRAQEARRELTRSSASTRSAIRTATRRRTRSSSPARPTRRSESQLARLADFHQRHAGEAPAALAKLQQVVIEDGNVFAELMNTVRVCSLGQITNALFEVGGQYRRSM